VLRPVVRIALGGVAVCSAVVALWLMLHNPVVTDPARGHYQCQAPYDTVLLDADNERGEVYESTAQRCREIGRQRFTIGVVSMSVGAAAAVALLSVPSRARLAARMDGRSSAS